MNPFSSSFEDDENVMRRFLVKDARTPAMDVTVFNSKGTVIRRYEAPGGFQLDMYVEYYLCREFYTAIRHIEVNHPAGENKIVVTLFEATREVFQRHEGVYRPPSIHQQVLERLPSGVDGLKYATVRCGSEEFAFREGTTVDEIRRIFRKNEDWSLAYGRHMKVTGPYMTIGGGGEYNLVHTPR